MKNDEIAEELKRINERLDQLEKIHEIANEQPVFNERQGEIYKRYINI